jgi:adenylate cyclase
MAEPGGERRLAAIVAIDVAGYSRLMEADEKGTLAALKGHRAATDPVGQKYGGRIVGTAGDGILLEFPSVVAAVECAVGIQAVMAERNADIADNNKMLLRIGVNLGDVLIDGDDIYGDGVNVAARLEGLAEPGGICVSAMVHDNVRDKMDIAFDDMGDVEVKNIARPVHVWRWNAEGQAAASPASAGGPLPLPDKPSIAVLAFENMSGDAEQEFFSDGIAEDIITALSRFHMFFVIARNTSFSYKGSNVDVKQVSRELGVQYVLEGSVRKAGNRVRVTAQLVDAIADRHVWAERYDRDLDDIFALQDEITERIAMAVAPELQAAEMERARRKTIPELGVWELVARANWHIGKFSANDNTEAQSLLLKALELDPVNAGVLSGLAASYSFDSVFGWRRPQPESLAMAVEMAQKAVASDKHDEGAHSILGLGLRLSNQNEEAIRRLKTAIRINPNSSSAIGWLGVTFVYTHEHDKAAELLHKAIRLSPQDPWVSVYILHLGMIEFMAENYDEALEWAGKAIHENPELPTGYRMLASIHGILGNLPEARAAYEQFIHRAPGMTIEAFLRGVPFAYPADAEQYAEGLRKAGMPEK